MSEDQKTREHAASPALREERARDMRLYVTGLIGALALTLLAFGLVWSEALSLHTTLWTISALAVAQMVVHFRCFLHIDLEKSHRDDLWLILFTALILLMMVAGTIWILYDQWARMM